MQEKPILELTLKEQAEEADQVSINTLFSETFVLCQMGKTKNGCYTFLSKCNMRY